MNNIKLFNYTYLILILSLISSCKEEEKLPLKPLVTLDNGVKVQVIYPAGSYWGKHTDYLPLPFHVAHRGVDTFLILGKPINANTLITVNPIGVAHIKGKGTNVNYILSLPQDSTRRSLPQQEFLELSTVNASVLWIIEQYLINYNHNNSSVYLSWKDETAAENILLK